MWPSRNVDEQTKKKRSIATRSIVCVCAFFYVIVCHSNAFHPSGSSLLAAEWKCVCVCVFVLCGPKANTATHIGIPSIDFDGLNIKWIHYYPFFSSIIFHSTNIHFIYIGSPLCANFPAAWMNLFLFTHPCLCFVSMLSTLLTPPHTHTHSHPSTTQI